MSLFSRSRFPNTAKYEAAQIQLIEDHKKFNDFGSTPLYQRYLELDKLVHTGEFEKRVKELKTKKFKDTPQYRQLRQFESLRKASDIKTYLKFHKSGKAEKLQKVLDSDKYKKFLELEKFVNSPEYYKAKAASDFKKSEAYASLKAYKKLKKDSQIHMALATLKSAAYKTYVKLSGSERLQSFFDLEAVVESKEFRDFKSYMEDKNRFKKSDEAHTLREYEELCKNPDITWYLKANKEHPFEELKKWNLTFEDDFDASRLNTERWITGYYWGKTLMNDTYALEGEHQIFKDSNIELRDSCATVSTRREEAEGKVWSPKWGFRTKKFNYTSGLISTGQSFRQLYGKFEAKVRFTGAFPINHAFWMTGEQIVPHIDIFKSVYPKGKHLEAGLTSAQPQKEPLGNRVRINGARFAGEFFIYSLEWTPEMLVWRINGIEVHRQTKNAPREPMYLSFCTTLPNEPNDKLLPATLEIDWVRCFKRVES